MSSTWCFMSATAILALIAAMVLANPEQPAPKQTIELKSISECEDRGTDELRFAVSEHDGFYSGCIIFKRPLDNTVQAVTEISRWNDGQNDWGRTFHVHRIADACVGFLSIFPRFGRTITECMGIEEVCPVPAGEYKLDKCALQLGYATRPLPTGEFRLTVSLMNTTCVLGRIHVVVEVSNCKRE